MTPQDLLRQALDPVSIARCQRDLAWKWLSGQLPPSADKHMPEDLLGFKKLCLRVLKGAIRVPERTA